MYVGYVIATLLLGILPNNFWNARLIVESSSTSLINRHYNGDQFIAKRTNKSEVCSKDFCKMDNRQAAVVPWNPCKCQCLPSSPVFRDDTGRCVESLYDCKVVPFKNAVTTEKVPLVSIPTHGQMIYPESEVALDEIANFRDVSCHVYAASYLSKNGWTPLENLTTTELAFQLVQNEEKIFLQFVGSEDLRPLLNGHVIIVELSCKTGNRANVVPRPCAAFRVAGTYEDFLELEVVDDSDSLCRWRTWVFIAFGAGLLGVTYVLAIMIYLMVRQKHKKKMNVVRSINEVQRSTSVPAAQVESETTAQDIPKQNTVESRQKILSRMRHAWIAVTSIFPRFRRHNTASISFSPSLNPIPEEQLPTCHPNSATVTEKKPRTIKLSKRISDSSDFHQDMQIKSPSFHQNTTKVGGEGEPRSVRKSKRVHHSNVDQGSYISQQVKAQKHRSYAPHDRASCRECRHSSQDSHSSMTLPARISRATVDSKRKSVSFDPTETFILGSKDSLTDVKNTQDTPFPSITNHMEQTSRTSPVPYRLTSFASLRSHSHCHANKRKHFGNNPPELSANSSNDTSFPLNEEVLSTGRQLTSILKRTKSSDDLKAAGLTSDIQHMELTDVMKRTRSVRESVNMSRPILVQNGSFCIKEVPAKNLQPGVQLRVPVKSLVECFNRKTTQGQQSAMFAPNISATVRGHMCMGSNIENGQQDINKQIVIYDDSGYQSSDSEVAEALVESQNFR